MFVLDYILKDTKKSQKGLKQGNGLTKVLRYFSHRSRRIWTPAFWLQVRSAFQGISKTKLLATSSQHTNMLNLPPKWTSLNRKQDKMCLSKLKEIRWQIMSTTVKQQTRLISKTQDSQLPAHPCLFLFYFFFYMISLEITNENFKIMKYVR